MHPTLMIDRALLVHDVWVNKILSGKKTWEMRSTRTKIRGRVGLIESGSGMIVGDVEIIDSLEPIDLAQYQKSISKHWVPKGLNGIREKYKYPWVLDNAKRYDEPMPYTHPQGAAIWVKF
jgi:hypothetical protein